MKWVPTCVIATGGEAEQANFHAAHQPSRGLPARSNDRPYARPFPASGTGLSCPTDTSCSWATSRWPTPSHLLPSFKVFATKSHEICDVVPGITINSSNQQWGTGAGRLLRRESVVSNMLLPVVCVPRSFSRGLLRSVFCANLVGFGLDNPIGGLHDHVCTWVDSGQVGFDRGSGYQDFVWSCDKSLPNQWLRLAVRLLRILFFTV